MNDSDGPDQRRQPMGEPDHPGIDNRQLEARVKQAEEKVFELQQQLQQAQKMETLGTLVAGVAHEINNPINLIMYNLPLIKQVWVDFQPLLRTRSKIWRVYLRFPDGKLVPADWRHGTRCQSCYQDCR